MPEDALIKALAQASDSLLAVYPDGAVLIDDQGRVIANHAKGGEMAEIITAEVARFSPGMPRRRLREKRQASSGRTSARAHGLRWPLCPSKGLARRSCWAAASRWNRR